ncbi:hypothetical protein BH753_gp164 [Bacillus phage Shbh1]|uniref:Uncharacterized protein n=1 Tax=Bacillus phage Shbh1 TaxID=1796992 RepID=A0A142F1I9_9CAUD|nr:hypothetical protein BH753_gp164 [Bacillus phage Shbh1]AMQ66646.1 hypothetical protein [Bacillus phage Shbh1]
MHKDSHGDIIVDTLQHYRERITDKDSDVPKPYQEIKKKLIKAMQEGKRVLIDIKDSYSVQTVVVRFEYIHDRWAMGKSICYTEDGEIEVPYTIHYSDVYCRRTKIKVITEGENPFDT